MTHTYTISDKQATGLGDLDGFRVECSCGDAATFSFAQMARDYGRDHVEYMNRKEGCTHKRRRQTSSWSTHCLNCGMVRYGRSGQWRTPGPAITERRS